MTTSFDVIASLRAELAAVRLINEAMIEQAKQYSDKMNEQLAAKDAEIERLHEELKLARQGAEYCFQQAKEAAMSSDVQHAAVHELAKQLAAKDVEIERLKTITEQLTTEQDKFIERHEQMHRESLIMNEHLAVAREEIENWKTTAEMRDIAIKRLDEQLSAQKLLAEQQKEQLAASQLVIQQMQGLIPQRVPNGFVSFGPNYLEQEDMFADPFNPMSRFKKLYLQSCEEALALHPNQEALEAYVQAAVEKERERLFAVMQGAADKIRTCDYVMARSDLLTEILARKDKQ